MNVAFTVINVLVGFLIIIMVSSSKLPVINVSTPTRVGLWIGAVGLICQALRTGFMLIYSSFPFSDFPIWMLKDIGYWFIAIGFFIHLYDEKKQ